MCLCLRLTGASDAFRAQSPTPFTLLYVVAAMSRVCVMLTLSVRTSSLSGLPECSQPKKGQPKRSRPERKPVGTSGWSSSSLIGWCYIRWALRLPGCSRGETRGEDAREDTRCEKGGHLGDLLEILRPEMDKDSAINDAVSTLIHKKHRRTDKRGRFQAWLHLTFNWRAGSPSLGGMFALHSPVSSISEDFAE